MTQGLRLLTGLVGLLAAPLAGAQPAAKVPEVAILCAGNACPAPPLEVTDPALLRGLEQAGYVDGRNVRLTLRASGIPRASLDHQAAELVRREVRVILALGSAEVRAAMQATTSIPIVMLAHDAVAQGFVASLDRPGGNVTGVTIPSGQLAAKQVELLREVVPTLSRIAVLWNPAAVDHGPMLHEATAGAKQLGIAVEPLSARGPADFDGVFSAIARSRAGALLVLPDWTFVSNRAELIRLALERRVPVVGQSRPWARGAALMAFGPSSPRMFERVGALVARILKGARPADLPVEEPAVYNVVLNLTTAKALGLTVPRAALARADELIE